VRVTAEGQLLLCLGNEHSVDLRGVIRAKDYTLDTLKRTIINAMSIKPESHHFDLDETPDIVRFMNTTGG
jgi:cyclic pyranopterin phosphate synthase